MSYVDRSNIEPLLPYIQLMRLHSLTGAYLLMWPALWAIAFSSSYHDSLPLGLIFLFVIGSIVMRSAGCVINDMVDRKIDAQVERTKDRPLASGQLKLYQAMLLLMLLLIIGLLILFMLNETTVFMGGVVIIPIVIYPFMKRMTYWPQLFLALTFNWGALMGWVAIREEVTLPALILYAACCFWTLGYDTIYGHQDKDDDIQIGIKSTALRFGVYTKRYLYALYGMATILLWLTGLFMNLSLLYHVMLIVASIQLLWQITRVDLDNPDDCMKKFKSNRWYGLIIFIGILLGRVYIG